MKLKIYIIYNPAILLGGVYPEPEQKFLVYIETCIRMFTKGLILIAKLETNT